MNAFDEQLAACGAGPLCATGIEVLQVNVGLRCNQSCAHCHLRASPARAELMGPELMAGVVGLAERLRPRLVDVTGGSPELHPGIRAFVAALAHAGLAVQLRTNLTALLEDASAGLPELLREHGVRLVASLPCYLEENVDRQRGRGVYRRSIQALRLLNALGYGRRADLPLDLVFNPGGGSLPPDQRALEEQYRHELGARHGVAFRRLLTLANAPLGGFREQLGGEGRGAGYAQLLRERFNPAVVARLMCRSQVEVAWDGRLYDCDFNLALGLPVSCGAGACVADFDAAALGARRIVTGPHCFACTAGAGSSCRGALTAA